jgi:hypothetical protein
MTSPKASKLLLILVLIAAAIAPGCGWRGHSYRDDTLYMGGFRKKKSDTKPKRAPHDDVSYWDGDSVAGEASIRIDLTEQRAYFYKGGQLVGLSAISTGREGFATPTGTYKIIQKNQDHKSNLYGNYVDAQTGEIVQKDVDVKKDPKPPGAVFDGARMPYFMRITGGVGMHEGFLPGYAASHGCIRMPGFMAERFFDNVRLGTPVSVTH